ncbi:hypothetical protein ACH4YO_42825, partial [Streptomyces noursei]
MENFRNAYSFEAQSFPFEDVLIFDAVFDDLVMFGMPGLWGLELVGGFTLLDHVAFPAGELAALYAQRWESELGFRGLKITQRGPCAILRSKTPALVSQEIWAYLVTHHRATLLPNLLRRWRRVGDDRLRVVVLSCGRGGGA